MGGKSSLVGLAMEHNAHNGRKEKKEKSEENIIS